MAATTAIFRFTGAGPTGASVAGGLKLTRDDSNVGTTPIPIPPTGSAATNFSYAGVLGLQVTNGTGSAISNKRLYQSGAGTTGMQLFHNTESTTPVTSTTYAQQTAFVAATTTAVTTAPTGYVIMTTSTTGTVYDSTSNTVANAANQLAGKYVLVLFGADQTATTTGNVTLPTLNLIYDEQ
jgi:hypothetical protein